MDYVGKGKALTAEGTPESWGIFPKLCQGSVSSQEEEEGSLAGNQAASSPLPPAGTGPSEAVTGAELRLPA